MRLSGNRPTVLHHPTPAHLFPVVLPSFGASLIQLVPQPTWKGGDMTDPPSSAPLLGLPALVVAISVGFTKAKGYSTMN